jgi:hypothetical protein
MPAGTSRAPELKQMLQVMLTRACCTAACVCRYYGRPFEARNKVIVGRALLDNASLLPGAHWGSTVLNALQDAVAALHLAMLPGAEHYT